MSIRPHDIALSIQALNGKDNVVPGRVRRHVFLGSSRDYIVETQDGTQLRVLTSAAESVPEGSAVYLHLPPERCRALAG
jgi:iron(III) transport system ATP-binding protein